MSIYPQTFHPRYHMYVIVHMQKQYIPQLHACIVYPHIFQHNIVNFFFQQQVPRNVPSLIMSYWHDDMSIVSRFLNASLDLS